MALDREVLGFLPPVAKNHDDPRLPAHASLRFGPLTPNFPYWQAPPIHGSMDAPHPRRRPRWNLTSSRARCLAGAWSSFAPRRHLQQVAPWQKAS